MKRIESPRLFAVLISVFFATSAFATQYSSVAAGAYSNPFTWDALGALPPPGAADTVTINHFVSVSGTQAAADVTISAGGGDLWQAGSTFDVHGDYTCNGAHTGTGTLNFRAASANLTIPLSASFDFGGTINVHSTTTLSASSEIKFMFANMVILSGASFVNNGTLWNRGTINGADGTSSFVQGVNARLYALNTVMATGSLDASTLGNFVYYWGDKTSFSVYDSDVNYRDVFLRNSGAYSLTIAEDLDINGFCYIVLAAQVFTGANTIDLAGDLLTWQANFPTNEGNLNFSGTGAQRIYDGSGAPLATIALGDVTISGDTLQPEIEPIINGTLTINDGNVFDPLTNGLDVQLGGDLSIPGTGEFRMDDNTVVTAVGSNAQSWSSTPTLQFQDFRVSKSGGTLTLTSGNYEIDSVLTLTGGTFDPNGNMVLLSDATRTARLAQVTGGSFSGNLVMQRYVGNRTANYNDLAAPGATTINDWDIELFTSGINGNEGNAYGPGGTFYSIHYYVEADAGFDSLTTTADALTSLTGYEMWLGSNLDTMLADTFDTRAIPHTGLQSKPLTFTNSHGWHLVGNPFASWIEWDSVFANTATVDNAFYVLNAASGTYSAYGATDRIPPSQGFWVHCTAATTLNIPENAKSTSASSTFYRLPNAYKEALRLKLSSDLNPYYNEAVVRFDAEADNHYGAADARFRSSPVKEAPGIRTLTPEGDELTVNSQSILTREASIPVKMEVGVSGTYKVEALGLDNITHFGCVVLEDKLTGRLYDLNAQPSVLLNIEASETTARFVLHLSVDGFGACTENTWLTTHPQSVVAVTANQGEIQVAVTNEIPADVTVAIYNNLGQKVTSDVVKSDVLTDYLRIAVPSEAGIYVVVVDSGHSRSVEKVYVN